MPSIDLNCDMGEHSGNDEALLNYVSSINIACGYHAGNSKTMREVAQMAAAKGVTVGAHPGYRDPVGFGRREMNLTDAEIFANISEQVGEMKLICESLDLRLNHVKPHGAMYNSSAVNPNLAHTIARAVKSIDPDLQLFGLAGSHSISEAKKIGLRTVSEVFGDRTYQSDGTLTPRNLPNSLIESSEQAIAQALQMIIEKRVMSTSGNFVAITAETICLHGDGKNALEFAREINRILAENNISIRST